MRIENNQIIADKGCYIRRKNSNALPYGRCTLLNGETEKDFDEFTQAEYDGIVKQQEEHVKIE